MSAYAAAISQLLSANSAAALPADSLLVSMMIASAFSHGRRWHGHVSRTPAALHIFFSRRASPCALYTPAFPFLPRALSRALDGRLLEQHGRNTARRLNSGIIRAWKPSSPHVAARRGLQRRTAPPDTDEAASPTRREARFSRCRYYLL